MRIVNDFMVFFRLYGFHRRGGKRRGTAARLAMRAFSTPF